MKIKWLVSQEHILLVIEILQLEIRPPPFRAPSPLFAIKKKQLCIKEVLISISVYISLTPPPHNNKCFFRSFYVISRKRLFSFGFFL